MFDDASLFDKAACETGVKCNPKCRIAARTAFTGSADLRQMRSALSHQRAI
jgi:hypothetical protein